MDWSYPTLSKAKIKKRRSTRPFLKFRDHCKCDARARRAQAAAKRAAAKAKAKAAAAAAASAAAAGGDGGHPPDAPPDADTDASDAEERWANQHAAEYWRESQSESGEEMEQDAEEQAQEQIEEEDCEVDAPEEGSSGEELFLDEDTWASAVQAALRPDCESHDPDLEAQAAIARDSATASRAAATCRNTDVAAGVMELARSEDCLWASHDEAFGVTEALVLWSELPDLAPRGEPEPEVLANVVALDQAKDSLQAWSSGAVRFASAASYKLERSAIVEQAWDISLVFLPVADLEDDDRLAQPRGHSHMIAYSYQVRSLSWIRSRGSFGRFLSNLKVNPITL